MEFSSSLGNVESSMNQNILNPKLSLFQIYQMKFPREVFLGEGNARPEPSLTPPATSTLVDFHGLESPLVFSLEDRSDASDAPTLSAEEGFSSLGNEIALLDESSHPGLIREANGWENEHLKKTRSAPKSLIFRGKW